MAGPPVAVLLLLAGSAFAPGEPTSDGCIQRVAVDALEDTTHGGLGRGDGAAVRLPAWATEPGQDRGVGGPPRDRGQGLRSGQDRPRGQREDEGEWGRRPWGRIGQTPVVRVRGRGAGRVLMAAMTCYQPGERSRLIYAIREG